MIAAESDLPAGFSPGAAPRVLIVDDDHDFAEGLEDFLSVHGYEVETANTPSQAYDIAEGFRPGVALVDIRLGQWNGLDVVTRLKTSPADPTCVMVTAFAELQTSIDAIRNGAQDYLRKPLDNAQVLAVLNRCFEIRRLENEKREIEERLRSSEERFRRTFEHAGVGMARIGPAGQIYRVNRRFCQMSGYSPGELVQMTWADLTYAEDISTGAEQLARVLAGEIEAGQEVSYRYCRKDGEIMWGETTLSLVCGKDGNPQYFIAVVVDVTERNRLQEQLIRAQRMDAMGQLTSGVAHEFNNLLMTIIGNLEFLGRPNIDADERHRFAGAAESAAWRGARLTRSLLAFSRKQPLQPKECSLNELLTEIHEMISRSLGEKITVQTELCEKLWPTLIDPAQLENAVLNLVINARDAMPRGGTVTITTANLTLGEDDVEDNSELQPGEYVILSVADTGEGMSSEIMRRAVEPFFTTKEVGEANGLGLSMVHGLARQSGGDLQVRSEPDRGATITIFLPRASAESSRRDKRRIVL